MLQCWHIAHGILMVISWGLLLPSGVIMECTQLADVRVPKRDTKRVMLLFGRCGPTSVFGTFHYRSLVARYFKTLGPQGPPAFWFKFHQACQVQRHELQAVRACFDTVNICF